MLIESLAITPVRQNARAPPLLFPADVQSISVVVQQILKYAQRFRPHTVIQIKAHAARLPMSVAERANQSHGGRYRGVPEIYSDFLEQGKQADSYDFCHGHHVEIYTPLPSFRLARLLKFNITYPGIDR